MHVRLHTVVTLLIVTFVLAMYPAAAVQRGILNEADALCLGAMDTASALLGSMRPSDYSYLRGQVTTCNNLMSGPLGETKGVGLAFSIDSHADVRAGSQKYFFGIRSALVWLRDTVWKGLLDEGEMNDMPGVFSGTLTHDANFKQSMRIVKSHVMLEKCDPDHVCYAHCAHVHGNAVLRFAYCTLMSGCLSACSVKTGQPTNQQKVLASLPTEEENWNFHLRGFAAGCVRGQDALPCHESVKAPPCLNGCDVGASFDEADAVNAT